MGIIISRTPLRVSLSGGGTDMPSFYEKHTGHVISCAIDKYIYVIIKERFDDRIVLNYTQHEIVDKVSDIKHDLIRECLELYGIEKGIEISTLADIPSEGSGLGSSSSVTVGLITALSACVGYPHTPKTTADLACQIEINVLSKPIGKQDQYIAAYGGMQHFTFKKDNVLTESYLPVISDYSKVGNNLFLHYTGKTRDANVILKEQNDNFEQNEKTLKTMAEDTLDLNKYLIKGDYDVIGDAISRGWWHKKSLAGGITNPELDDMVDLALRSGATGAKICGAGGGGFLLSYVPIENHAKFIKGMAEYRELPFNIDPYGSRIIFNIT